MAKTREDYEKEIEVLTERVKEAQEIMEKIMAEEKYVGKVQSGPEINENVPYWRVSGSGTGDKIVSFAQHVMFEKTPLKIGQEVIVLKSAIIAVIPEPLLVKTNDLSNTKLAAWEEIGGSKTKIKAIRDAVEAPLKHAEIAKEFGLVPIKGILLSGPPGCGKTMIAKAIAQTILKDSKPGVGSFIYVKGPELLSMYVGEAERAIREVFIKARKYAMETGYRSVLFIDEAEAALPARGSRKSSDVESTTVPQFLAEMDGFNQYGPIVILASNKPDAIDEAILREGRVDLKIQISRPDKAEVLEIMNIQMKSSKTHDDKTELATHATELLFHAPTEKKVSGSMAAAMVNMAKQEGMYRYIANKKSPMALTKEDFTAAYEKIAAQ